MNRPNAKPGIHFGFGLNIGAMGLVLCNVPSINRTWGPIFFGSARSARSAVEVPSIELQKIRGGGAPSRLIKDWDVTNPSPSVVAAVPSSHDIHFQ